MADYGHEILFGTFITPLNSPPQHAVDLAVRTERAGLDLVTFQDHPYQPRFHDTWTLLSYGPLTARPDLVRTLHVALLHNCSIGATADDLHFHYNTVRNRLKRVEEILGPVLDGGQKRAELLIACEIWARSR